MSRHRLSPSDLDDPFPIADDPSPFADDTAPIPLVAPAGRRRATAPAPAVRRSRHGNGAARRRFRLDRRTGLVVLAVVAGFVAVPTVGSAAVDPCHWQQPSRVSDSDDADAPARCETRSMSDASAKRKPSSDSSRSADSAKSSKSSRSSESTKAPKKSKSPSSSAAPTTSPAGDEDSSSAPTSASPPPAGGPTIRGVADVMNVEDWYLTLPTGKQGDPDTVEAPALADYSSTWFRIDDDKDCLAFTANVGGATTKGSHYPRSELREMNGKEMASWSNTSGTHTLSVRQAVMALPTAKPEVITAQIHDTKSDVVAVRLEGERLIAQYNDGKTDVTLDPAYKLGTPYDLKIVAADSRVDVFYNGEKKAEIPESGSGWYYKSGAYVQSNTSKGDDADTVGTVDVFKVDVAHTP